VHTYQKYDPQRFPSPTAPPSDVASAAMDHLMMYGSGRRLTPEELAEAIEIDPSQIAGLGPSLDALIRVLEERRRKILETHETEAARRAAATAYLDQAGGMEAPRDDRERFDRAVRGKQLREIERLWYRQERESSRFAMDLLKLRDRLGEVYELDDLDSRWDFTGRAPMTVDEALAVKEELEEIERLLEQLGEAMKNAKVGIIDAEALAKYAEEADMDRLRDLAAQLEEMVRAEAERAGMELTPEGYRVTPKALRMMQGRLLEEIFSQLEAARSGRHAGPITGDGAVELPRTKAYEFGDSPAHMDVPQTFVNALLREGSSGGRVRVSARDIEIHETRNTPKCATAVLMDMSGSMRHGGQYIDCKKMALALDGLIRSEFPGDHLTLLEMATFARVAPSGEIAELLPKPVTIRNPVVRLMADMSDPQVTPTVVPPHFTNIQHALRLSRRILGGQDTPNRQVFLITDGLPTAHFEDEKLYMLYPPDPRTEEATMREASACAREGITINLFLLPSWSQSEEDVKFAHAIAEKTGGRVLFTGGGDLDRYVIWDYVSRRRKIIG